VDFNSISRFSRLAVHEDWCSVIEIKGQSNGSIAIYLPVEAQ
jgi:hypothetical protein